MSNIYSESYPWEIDARFDQEYLYVLEDYYTLLGDQHMLNLVRLFRHLKLNTFPKDDTKEYMSNE